ncbi:MAG: OmpA family protein, partial [Myxococcota bacterium]
RVRAPSGPAWVTAAAVRLGRPRFLPPMPVDPDGQRLLGLEPGPWQVLVSSPDQGLQQVSVEVPDRPQLTELTVELGPAPADIAQTIVRVQAPDGSPIPDAMVRVDELEPVAASGGFASLPNVSPGPHRLEITAPDFEPVVLDDVDVVEGINERIVPMPWVPRPLSVLVRGPAGPIAATLALQGPVEVPAVQTNEAGEAKLELAPGKWRILAFADGLGVRGTQIELSERTGISEAEFDLKPAKVSIDGNTLRVSEQIFFPSGKAVLDRSSTDLLDEVANTLFAHPELVSVEIGGHTDPQGGIADNMRLSQARADAVATALSDRGVAPERLNARGYGPTQPQAENDTAEGRAKNRRVEFVSETQE